MKKIILSAFVLILISVLSFRYFSGKGHFSAKTEKGKIVIMNHSEEHYPGVSVICLVNGEQFSSVFKFLPGKGRLQLAAKDFSTSDGRQPSTLDKIERLMISGGDQLIDEGFSEEIRLR
ncbi:MAG: hypothetical protein INR69_08685 [Mucilaginibacter polytrichastri]|nr:hypothetical protein [Mucilaginibacter polytrichastri]